MLEVGNNTEVLLANGNRMKGKEEDLLLDSPELKKRLQATKEEVLREKQFGELIMHVIDQIEKESEDDPFNDKDLWPTVSLLDMKKFLKGDVHVTGVSENSPIHVLDSVNGKVGQALHNFNIYEISQLASCTKVELSHMIKQANLPPYELEYALQDAKGVMDILESEKNKPKETNAWNSWTQMGDLLQIKESSKKIANMMGSAKSFTASLVGVLKNNRSDDDDIDSFEEI